MRDGLVVARAPLRVSFVGGGSDLPPSKPVDVCYGAVVSAALEHYVYCVAKARRDGKFYLSWREKEVVSDPIYFHHTIVRNVFKEIMRTGAGFDGGVELAFLADVPGNGSGLGSSAATAASCILALYHLLRCDLNNPPEHGWKGELARMRIARKAAAVQENAGTRYHGMQDEVATATGGLNEIRFATRGVTVDPLDDGAVAWLEQRFALFSPPPDVQRSAAMVLQTYREDEDLVFRDTCLEIVDAFLTAVRVRDLKSAADLVERHGNLKARAFGGYWTRLLHEASERASDAGARCVKLCGAGGTGHLLAGFDPERRPFVVEALTKVWGAELPLRIADDGAEIVYPRASGIAIAPFPLQDLSFS